MPLDKQARALIERFVREGTPPVSKLTPAEARRLTREVNRRLTSPPEAVAVVKNMRMSDTSAQIPVRVYIPREGEVLPVLVYFHGGGWVLGDLDSVDSLCRSLANAADCVVVSVEYRWHQNTNSLQLLRTHTAQQNGPQTAQLVSVVIRGGSPSEETVQEEI